MQRYSLLFFIFLLSYSSLNAVAIKITNPNSHLYNEVDQSYDIKKSWWWYEETVPVKDKNSTNPQKTIDKKIRYKVTPVENNQLKLLKQMVQNQTDTINELKKVVNILEYNFPRRFPKWTINKKTGKKCLSNSSGDCYVPILIPEAQQVPAMAAFLRNPSMKNAKTYLGFQSAHFNHVMKIGYGLSFAYKQYGKKAYKTASMLGTGTPLGIAGKYRYGAKYAFLQQIQKQLKVYIFFGKTQWMEDRVRIKKLALIDTNIFSTFDNVEYVHLDQESYDRFDDVMKRQDPSDYKTWKNIKYTIGSKLFKKFKVDFTPFIVVTYTNKKGVEIWQKIGYAVSQKRIASEIYDFLEYNGVVKPENIDEAKILKLKSYSMPGDTHLDAEAAGIQMKPMNFNMKNVNKDQIIKKRKKND